VQGVGGKERGDEFRPFHQAQAPAEKVFFVTHVKGFFGKTLFGILVYTKKIC
jgi:hypothetical protein